MAEYHVRHGRISSGSAGSGSDDFEDESLDPRIQVELEKLNKASEEINKLELELDDARASFRQTLSESTQKLDMLAKKLGSCVEKARPYYDSRVKAKEAHLETQRAALRFERACSMHEAAKEMVQLAEQGYMRREQPSDPAWQEMLNHATMKVNEAEKERNESEQEHQRTMTRFKVAEDQVQGLQKELKRAITKSKPYFEMKARFNQIMEEHKQKVGVLEEDVSSAKSLYSTALRSLEAISDEIHRQRLERRQQQQLGVRGAGVGAECPLPPPAWEKGLSIDGRELLHGGTSLDPLGVIKIPPAHAAYGAGRRSRNLSGESNHGRDVAEGEMPLGRSGSPSFPAGQDEEQVPVSASTTTVTAEDSASLPATVTHSPSPEKEKVLIPGDPLGVLPPTYTSSTARLSPATGPSISHPAFSATGAARAASHSSGVVHPLVSPQTHSGQRSKSATNAPEPFVPPSVIHPTPGKARNASYRRAVDSSQKDGEEDLEFPEAPDLDAEYLSLPGTEARSRTVCESLKEPRQRSHSNPPHPDLRTRSPPHAIPGRPGSALQEALADGRRHGSAPEKSGSLTSYSQHAVGLGEREGSPVDSSPSSARRSHKLQGLILRIDPSMDPMYDFEPRGRTQTVHEIHYVPVPAPTRPAPHTNSPASVPDPEPEDDPSTPTPAQSADSLQRRQISPCAGINSESKQDYNAATNTISKPIIRSASSVSSTAGSERSETEFSELESVSATQSPTKPRSRLLKVPSSIDVAEDSSDTESLASTGPMLDDEQVEFLTMDFSDTALTRDPDNLASYASATLPAGLKRQSWSRMSLPPRLSFLEEFLSRAKRLSGDLDDTVLDPGCDEIQLEDEEGERTLISDPDISAGHSPQGTSSGVLDLPADHLSQRTSISQTGGSSCDDGQGSQRQEKPGAEVAQDCGPQRSSVWKEGSEAVKTENVEARPPTPSHSRERQTPNEELTKGETIVVRL